MNSNLFSSDQETYFTWLTRQIGQRSQFCTVGQHYAPIASPIIHKLASSFVKF
ncbi:hypothetical protein H6F78_26220 [Coleofasciculus sp. FACHB-64]|uniref:hypothetical protein n=1 Tax=Cyanophyceae TaxID=3028117 RepID=UPI00168252AF|nr:MULTISPECIES: hypothetical protein [unclassified Coleofasciculus]MBD1841628.1 hypothetical protein [Coleofasciculus sp. FACHB-501]MBD1878784.1 hypothetical protein [Coleofasciculus sp. FACHB-T130]MBD1892849.1 hypothetical protein [Coleofasciculus sp. FACHB-SPT9]MBD1894474.1 hypothetical protein [Coleofasciculus sp. FACHB-129]MBD1903103.1 hypothetical protein [Coleofasciculus sp. FACHB-125]